MKSIQIVKNKKGITLIALVVTIVVLLILAGVTILTLTGENGLLKIAEKARKGTLEKQDLENQTISNYEGKIDEYIHNARDVELSQEVKDYIDAKINEINLTQDGTITKSSSISAVDVYYFKYNKHSVNIALGITLSKDLGSGSSVTIGQIDQEQARPLSGRKGLGYYGARGIIGNIDSDGTISLRNVGTTAITSSGTASTQIALFFNFNLL